MASHNLLFQPAASRLLAAVQRNAALQPVTASHNLLLQRAPSQWPAAFSAPVAAMQSVSTVPLPAAIAALQSATQLPSAQPAAATAAALNPNASMAPSWMPQAAGPAAFSTELLSSTMPAAATAVAQGAPAAAAHAAAAAAAPAQLQPATAMPSWLSFVDAVNLRPLQQVGVTQQRCYHSDAGSQRIHRVCKQSRRRHW